MKTLVIILSKVLYWVGKIIGKGSSLPGKIALKIEQSKDSSGVNPFKALPAGIPKALRETLGNSGSSTAANKAEIDKFVKNVKTILKLDFKAIA